MTSTPQLIVYILLKYASVCNLCRNDVQLPLTDMLQLNLLRHQDICFELQASIMLYNNNIFNLIMHVNQGCPALSSPRTYNLQPNPECIFSSFFPILHFPCISLSYPSPTLLSLFPPLRHNTIYLFICPMKFLHMALYATEYEEVRAAAYIMHEALWLRLMP